VAYRAKRREGASDQEAHEAAVAAVQEVLPLPRKEASAEAVNAVAYATKYHSERFWQGLRIGLQGFSSIFAVVRFEQTRRTFLARGRT
jgi:hypothetical protein